MKDKMGTYIQTLMTTVIDKEQEQFVKDLAWDELQRLNTDIEAFLRKYSRDDSKEQENTEQILLQEDKENVKNK